MEETSYAATIKCATSQGSWLPWRTAIVGSAKALPILCVRYFRWERERERERYRERDGSDVTIVALKLAMNLHFPMAQFWTRAISVTLCASVLVGIGDEFTLSNGTVLNKSDFRDAMCLRFGFPLDGMSSTCVCGNAMTVDHALTCPCGGYIIARHNEVRDCIAETAGTTFFRRWGGPSPPAFWEWVAEIQVIKPINRSPSRHQGPRILDKTTGSFFLTSGSLTSKPNCWPCPRSRHSLSEMSRKRSVSTANESSTSTEVSSHPWFSPPQELLGESVMSS